MQDQYSRTQLLLGKEAMEKLRNSRVAVFGIGGVGGYTVEALARSGVGALDLIDDDKVCLTNLNRQIVATRKTVGQYKVDVAEQRIHEIDPKIYDTVPSGCIAQYPLLDIFYDHSSCNPYLFVLFGTLQKHCIAVVGIYHQLHRVCQLI